jgi:Ca2+-binding RTX toxin-like protein
VAPATTSWIAVSADVMAVGAGNDIYYVGNVGDTVIEAVGALT